MTLGNKKTVFKNNSYKKHILLVFRDRGQRGVLEDRVSSLRQKFPTIKVKTIEIEKDWRRPIRHRILKLPTVILLKDGMEVDRIEDDDKTLLEILFRKATM